MLDRRVNARTLENSRQQRDATHDISRLVHGEYIGALLENHVRAFSQGELIVEDCRVENATYRARKRSRDRSIAVTHRLSVREAITGRLGEQLLYIKGFRDGRSAAEYAQACAAELAQPRYVPPVLHIDEHDVVVWGFPNDPRMPQLARLFDPIRAKAELPYQAMAPEFASSRDVASVAVSVVNYRPELRCTFRLQVRPRRGDDLARMLYAKTFSDESGVAITERFRAYAARDFGANGSFRIAPVLDYAPSTRTLWQAGIDGISVDRLISIGQGLSLMHGIGAGLAGLHESCLPVADSVELSTHLDELERKIKVLTARQGRVEVLESLAEYLDSAALNLPASPMVTIHGDFHVRQLIVASGQIYLCDFDECALGDPAQDVGNLIADLLASGCDPATVREFFEAMLSGYASRARASLAPERIYWHALLQLVNKAYRHLKQLRPHLERRLGEMLERMDSLDAVIGSGRLGAWTRS